MTMNAASIAVWVSQYYNETIVATETAFANALLDTLADLSNRPEGDLLRGQESTLSTTADAITVDLSSLTGLKRVTGVQLLDDDDNATRREPLDEISYRDLMAEKDGESSSAPTGTARPLRYAVWNGSLVLDPTPDAAYDLIVDYTKRHARSSSTIEYADACFEAIALGTFYRYLMTLDQPSRAADYKGLYENEIANLLGTHRPTPPRQVKYREF